MIAVQFLGLGLLFVYAGWGRGEIGWPALWAGAGFLWVALAYILDKPSMLGKRRDGRIAAWSWICLAPYLLFARLGLALHAARRNENPCDEVSPGLWLGRRVNALPGGIGLVADLTAEFPEPAGVMRGRRYLCLPTLDGAAPEETGFRVLVEEAASFKGSVYVHCAVGHGRSAALVAGVLLRKGLASDVDEAVRLIRKARPKARLSGSQRSLLGRCFPRPNC